MTLYSRCTSSPVSSRTSRTAACSGDSPGSMRPCTVSHAVGQRVCCARCSVSTLPPRRVGRDEVHVDGADVDVGHALNASGSPNATHSCHRTGPARNRVRRHRPRQRSSASTVASTTRPCVVRREHDIGVVREQAHMLAGRAVGRQGYDEGRARLIRPPGRLDTRAQRRERHSNDDDGVERLGRRLRRRATRSARRRRTRRPTRPTDLERRCSLRRRARSTSRCASARTRRAIGHGRLGDAPSRLGGDAPQLVDRGLAAANEREARLPEWRCSRSRARRRRCSREARRRRRAARTRATRSGSRRSRVGHDSRTRRIRGSLPRRSPRTGAARGAAR